MKPILLVVLAGVLMVPGAWAYSPGERAGVEAGGIAEAGGINACPVVGNPVPHSGLQRIATDAGSLSTVEYPRSPVASCGQAAQSAPALLAQQFGVCRASNGQYCLLAFPHYQGQPCCCFVNGVAWMCGSAQPY